MTTPPADPERPPFAAVGMDELETIDVAGVGFRPVRRRLGVRSFGVNAFTAADAGQQVIESHTEDSSGAGRQEEMYVVLRGRATFTVDGRELDAPAGTMVLVSDTHARRSAVAAEPDTTVLVVGGPADRALPTSPFEFWFAAEPAYRAGDYRRAVEIASAGLEEWPDHGMLHYQLACYQALAGRPDAALEHLRRAAAGEPMTADWAQSDCDLDSIRNDPRFPKPTA